MKKIISIALSAAMLGCLTAAMTGCFRSPEPPMPTGDITSPVTTVRIDETDETAENESAAERKIYTLESEENGWALTLSAMDDATLEISYGEDAGLPTLTATAADSGKSLTLRVDAPQEKTALDAAETQALADGGEQIMLGSYGGYTVPASRTATVLLEKSPAADAWFTLRISAGGEDAIGDLLKDAALAELLSSMVFNINA